VPEPGREQQQQCACVCARSRGREATLWCCKEAVSSLEGVAHASPSASAHLLVDSQFCHPTQASETPFVKLRLGLAAEVR
jgi:hypothetical protein